MASDSATGLDKNTSAALSYVLGPLTGILFLVLEKDSYVRFHAMQSIVVLGGLIVLSWVLELTVILDDLNQFVSLAYFVLFLTLIYKAWNGERWEVPFVDRIIKRIYSKL